jgi:hypothetical protein
MSIHSGWLALVLLACAGQAAAASLAIPAGHPRIWYGNEARLAQARAHFASAPFTPAGNDATERNTQSALRGLLTGNAADCDAAVAHLAAWRFEAQGVGPTLRRRDTASTGGMIADGRA